MENRQAAVSLGHGAWLEFLVWNSCLNHYPPPHPLMGQKERMGGSSGARTQLRSHRGDTEVGPWASQGQVSHGCRGISMLCAPGSLGGAAPRREEGWPAWFTHVWAGDHWWLISGLRGRMLCPGQVPGLQVPSPLSPATADPSKTVCVCVCVAGCWGKMRGRNQPLYQELLAPDGAQITGTQWWPEEEDREGVT